MKKTEKYLFSDYAIGLRTDKTNVGIYSKTDMKNKLFDCNSMAMAVGNARGAHNVLLDIAGVPLDVVKEKEEQMNRELEKNGKDPKRIITNLDFYHDGKRYRYAFNDSRLYVPLGDYVTGEILHENSKALLKIKFLKSNLKL
ncbi:MAG: hypothetical protein Q4C29_00830 [bacterium]|nr:hypothetical protein [bacterium]